MIEPSLSVDFTDKVAVVIGAGGVLYGEMTRAFAWVGTKVAILNLNEEATKKSFGTYRVEGFIREGYKVDILDPEALAEAHAQVCRTPGPCDILISGTGGNSPRVTTNDEYQHEAKPSQKAFFNLDTSRADFVFKLSLQDTPLPAQAFTRDMVKRGSRCILGIFSMNVYTPLARVSAYSDAKAAINNFTQWLVTYFAGTGIYYNTIAPGFLVSNQNRRLLFNEGGTLTPRTAKILIGTPMGRFVENNELLGGVFFLYDGRAASAITGVVLSIDVGFAAYSGV